MTRSRLWLAIAIALLVFSAFMLGKMAPSLTSVEKPSDQSSFKPLDNPALGIGIGDKVFQARIYAIVRV
ncbi:hypothetical protein MUP79_08420 [Candidatus Bathyarchaeota archaeon]|nr:hypothetical protein [Candidatus Bathyarchaeota archaeon]